ncbi:MAG: hypothetical protein NTW32_07235 [Chloroflexi bacterium]|nr:hypothetical protein [Chloroflexota bacterium]
MVTTTNVFPSINVISDSTTSTQDSFRNSNLRLYSNNVPLPADKKPVHNNSAVYTMNEISRQKLVELVGTYGCAVVTDRRRCEGLLRDCSGVYKREVNLLIMALKEGIPQDLFNQISNLDGVAEFGDQSSNGSITERTFPKHLILCQFETRMINGYSITPEAARWVVEAWALALSYITLPELSDFSNPCAQSVAQKTGGFRSALVSDGRPALIVSRFGGGHYKSISEAIHAATPGMRIIVKPGHYKETIVLNKSLEVIGDGQPGDVVVDSEACMVTACEHSKIQNVTLRGFCSVEKGRLDLCGCQVLGEIRVIGESSKLLASNCNIEKIDTDSGTLHLEECDIHIMKLCPSSKVNFVKSSLGSLNFSKMHQPQPIHDSIDLLGLLQCLTDART